MKDSFQVMGIPLIAQQDSLLGIWWNRFQLARNFQREDMFWDSHRVMIPSDALETAMTVETVPYLRTVYPAAPPLWSLFYFPADVNIPKPLLCSAFILL